MFTTLGLLGDEDGKVVVNADSPPLRELFGKIQQDSEEGHKASGRSLTEHFGRDPFGWDFEVTRLMVASLLAADKIQIRAGNTIVDSRRAPGAKDVLTNNNNFRSATISPKKGIDFAEVAKASKHFKDTFGREVREINQSAVVSELRGAVADVADDVQTAHNLLVSNRLPGVELLHSALERMRPIQRGTEEQAIGEFNSSYQAIKEGIRRAGELNQYLTSAVLQDLESARLALSTQWPVLDQEPDLDESVREVAERLKDLLARETFFRDLADLDACREVIEKEHERRFGEELEAKLAVYSRAIEQLAGTPGWSDLDDEVRKEIAAPLHAHATDKGDRTVSIQQLRADRDACATRLQQAIRRVHEIIEGDRVVSVNVQPYFRGGVGDVEQLGAALEGLRGECERLIAEGKKIIVA